MKLPPALSWQAAEWPEPPAPGLVNPSPHPGGEEPAFGWKKHKQTNTHTHPAHPLHKHRKPTHQASEASSPSSRRPIPGRRNLRSPLRPAETAAGARGRRGAGKDPAGQTRRQCPGGRGPRPVTAGTMPKVARPAEGGGSPSLRGRAGGGSVPLQTAITSGLNPSGEPGGVPPAPSLSAPAGRGTGRDDGTPAAAAASSTGKGKASHRPAERRQAGKATTRTQPLSTHRHHLRSRPPASPAEAAVVPCRSVPGLSCRRRRRLSPWRTPRSPWRLWQVPPARLAPHSGRAGGRKEEVRAAARLPAPFLLLPSAAAAAASLPSCPASFPRRFLLRSTRAAPPRQGLTAAAASLAEAGRAGGGATGSAQRVHVPRVERGWEVRASVLHVTVGPVRGRDPRPPGVAAPGVVSLVDPPWPPHRPQPRGSHGPRPTGSSRGPVAGAVSSSPRCCSTLPAGRAVGGRCLLRARCPGPIARGLRWWRKGERPWAPSAQGMRWRQDGSAKCGPAPLRCGQAAGSAAAVGPRCGAEEPLAGRAGTWLLGAGREHRGARSPVGWRARHGVAGPQLRPFPTAPRSAGTSLGAWLFSVVIIMSCLASPSFYRPFTVRYLWNPSDVQNSLSHQERWFCPVPWC